MTRKPEAELVLSAIKGLDLEGRVKQRLFEEFLAGADAYEIKADMRAVTRIVEELKRMVAQ